LPELLATVIEGCEMVKTIVEIIDPSHTTLPRPAGPFRIITPFASRGGLA
jgi:hypothetical protein